jgi:hypothetical protein
VGRCRSITVDIPSFPGAVLGVKRVDVTPDFGRVGRFVGGSGRGQEVEDFVYDAGYNL